ncbi:hypothetical protein BDN72DRAFT_305210 [Pluteus cervinus]|uniref:Uncharacterized protein n=1 Tax=Pluteus cervinus TaxID=181527 RepID=A0ACD3B465_9AGAR|nr:hypothetical protein BDN72DRAFT_305210 [Pluteus cervinus]
MTDITPISGPDALAKLQELNTIEYLQPLQGLNQETPALLFVPPSGLLQAKLDLIAPLIGREAVEDNSTTGHRPWNFGGTLYYKNVEELIGSSDFYALVTGDEERTNIIFSRSTLPKDIFAFYAAGVYGPNKIVPPGSTIVARRGVVKWRDILEKPVLPAQPNSTALTPDSAIAVDVAAEKGIFWANSSSATGSIASLLLYHEVTVESHDLKKRFYGKTWGVAFPGAGAGFAGSVRYDDIKNLDGDYNIIVYTTLTSVSVEFLKDGVRVATVSSSPDSF